MAGVEGNGPPGGHDPLIGMAEAWATAGTALWHDLFRAGWFAAQDAANGFLQHGGVPAHVEHWVRAFARGAQTYCTEMAFLWPRAVDRLSRGVDDVARSRTPVAPGVAPKHREMRLIDGVPVALPVRIVDASQAFAFYLVSARHACAFLREQQVPFTAVDVGNGRTPLAILGVDYRETDLGAYQELGVCLFVKPIDSRERSCDVPGTLFASLTVNDRFNVRRAAPLWGYNKTYTPHLQLHYEREAVAFSVDGHDPGALSVTFPRFGASRSTEIPCYTWGVDHDRFHGPAPVKTLIVRSATGEGVQVSGNVDLRLGDGTQPRCVCKLEAAREQACVCLMLRELALPKRPIANTWAEHMCATCAEGVVLRGDKASAR